jgi:8-amino-7-oxononanoate synthase
MAVADTWALEELELLSARGLRRRLEPLESPQGPVVRVGGETLINFSSNDYLGLANDQRLVEAAESALRHYGVGSGASRLVVGDSLVHQSLERAIADFEGAEAALLFNSGYAANLGIISTLCGPDDVVFSDALNHASLIDGCRLSRARVVIYPHTDVQALEKAMREHEGRRQLVVTDSVFSMDGDLAPLVEISTLCRRRGAALMVDEAHATGVLGPSGAGLCEELGLTDVVDLRMGTLGKALGCVGAYVACSAPMRELLFNRARSLVFSTSLPAAMCAAAERAIALVREGTEARFRLANHRRRFAAGLLQLGIPQPASFSRFEEGASVPRPEPRVVVRSVASAHSGRRVAEPVGHKTLPEAPRAELIRGGDAHFGCSAIFPVVLGDAEVAMRAAEQLRSRGLLVKAIRPPTVPAGTSRLRFALSAGHREIHLDHALQALADVLHSSRGALA